MKISYGFTLALAAVLAPAAMAQSQQAVSMGRDSSQVVSGRVRGKGYADFLIKAGAGQSFEVKLSAPNSTYFNFNPPRSDASLFIGNMDGNHMATRMVPSDGEYIVRVYQMGAAADEGRTSQFTLTIKLTGRALKPITTSSDARVPGTHFHAHGPIPAKLSLEPSRKECDAWVVRRDAPGAGTATVELRLGRMARHVLFLRGKPVAHDSFEAFTYERRGDETIVRFGDQPTEQYTIPDMLIYGG